MTSNDKSSNEESTPIVAIKGTGPKERPPVPADLLKPPGAKPGKKT